MHINVNAYFKEYKMNLSFEIHDKNDSKVLLVLLFIFFFLTNFALFQSRFTDYKRQLYTGV